MKFEISEANEPGSFNFVCIIIILSFGFSDKHDTPKHLAVGQYGNGFKSGSMRLGRDAIVFSNKNNTKTIGFLSQTFLESIKATTVLVPIVSWNIASNILLFLSVCVKCRPTLNPTILGLLLFIFRIN